MNNRLRVLRAERGWSQAQLAERVAVSRQTVNAIETGKYDPSLPLAFALALVFDRRIEEIFSPPAARRNGAVVDETTVEGSQAGIAEFNVERKSPE